MLTHYTVNYYQVLLNYSFTKNLAINNGQVLNICCSSTQCINVPSPCPSSYEYVTCVKVNQAITCGDVVSSCFGIVGTTPITSNTTLVPSACPSNSNYYFY